MSKGFAFFHNPRGQNTLEKAKRLLTRQPISPEDAPVIAGCVTVMLAAGLDQGTKGILEFLARTASDDSDSGAVQRLSAASLSKRVMDLPQAMSPYSLQMSRSHAHVRALMELIQWRNRLVHPSDDFRDLDIDTSQGLIGDGAVIELPPLKPDADPWDALQTSEAERFCVAVTSYFDEVLNMWTMTCVLGLYSFLPCGTKTRGLYLPI